MAEGAPSACAPSATTCRTTAVTLLSTEHGRMRRAQRLIEKRDLQAAVKHGIRTVSRNPRGELNYRYEFAEVVFITDATSTKEVTSWAAPGAGLDVALVDITPAMEKAHAEALCEVTSDPSKWTSHTVIVVDQSGSMRKTDVPGGATRSDAVWVTIALEFVAKQLDNNEASWTDIVSVVSMCGESSIVIDRQPTDWVLFNSLVCLLRSSEPHFDGNYLPALDTAERLLMLNSTGSCALSLFFLSDGKPSDKLPRGSDSSKSTRVMTSLVSARIDALASRFGRRLSVTTFGFAGEGEQFDVLEGMASRPTQFGSMGRFHATGLSLESLSSAFSSLALSNTVTRTELTALDSSVQRPVRDVRREARDTADETRLGSNWLAYRRAAGELEPRTRWSVETKRWVDSPYLSSTTVGVAMRQKYFGEGAERLVRKFREFDLEGNFVGPLLVCKESRFTTDNNLRTFHLTFCETQTRAARLAATFNERLARLPCFDTASTPRIEFLDCSVYIVNGSNGRTGVLVEKMLNQSMYKVHITPAPRPNPRLLPPFGPHLTYSYSRRSGMTTAAAWMGRLRALFRRTLPWRRSWKRRRRRRGRMTTRRRSWPRATASKTPTSRRRSRTSPTATRGASLSSATCRAC